MLGKVIKYLPTVFHTRGNVISQMTQIGVKSLPLVLMIGLFTGAISALQATNLFAKFNLVSLARTFIGGSIATVVFTELSPVLTALVIAGRIGGSIAAQIGTMVVSEQVDALEMMAIPPARYLAMPRVFATAIMLPVLIVFSNIIAIVGSYILMVVKFGFSAEDFFGSLQRYFAINELLTGLFKAFIFGCATSVLSCHVGFSTTGGAEGVGASTVRAFTLSSSSILLLDALLGYLL